MDFEAELCVVIGRTAKRVGRAEALAYVGGYTVMNDLSAKISSHGQSSREAQTTTLALKGVDGFAPLGAVRISPDEAGNTGALEIVCRVNGEERQRYPGLGHGARRGGHDRLHLVDHHRLNPGDLLSMGTSVGIGIVEVPPAPAERRRRGRVPSPLKARAAATSCTSLPSAFALPGRALYPVSRAGPRRNGR